MCPGHYAGREGRLVTWKDEEQSREIRVERKNINQAHTVSSFSRTNTAVHDFEVLSSQVT